MAKRAVLYTNKNWRKVADAPSVSQLSESRTGTIYTAASGKFT
jgi:hypothetical protein